MLGILERLQRPHVAIAVNRGDGVHGIFLAQRAVGRVIGQDNLVVHDLEQAVPPCAQEISVRFARQEINPVGAMDRSALGGHIVPRHAVVGVDSRRVLGAEKGVGCRRGNVQHVLGLVIGHPEGCRERQSIGLVIILAAHLVQAILASGPPCAVAIGVAAAEFGTDLGAHGIQSVLIGLEALSRKGYVEQEAALGLLEQVGTVVDQCCR